MSKTNRIGIKLVFAFILVAVLSVSFQLLILSQSISRITTEDSLKYLTELSTNYANEAKKIFENGLELSTQLTAALQGIQEIGESRNTLADRELAISVLESMHSTNPWISALWTCWIPNSFDGQDKLYVNKPGHDNTGRLIALSYTVNGKNSLGPLVDYEKPGDGDYYLIPFNTQREAVVEPYPYSYPEGNKLSMTSMVVPIKQDGKVVGVSGVDVDLAFFKKHMSSLSPMDAGSIMLISPELTIVGHSNPDMVGKVLKGVPYNTFISQIEKAVISGQPVVKVINESWDGQEDAAVAIIPFAPGNTDKNWAIATIVPVSRVMQTTNILMNSSLTTGLVTLILTIIIGMMSVKIVSRYTKDLHALKEAQAELDVSEKSNRAKSTFLANISHEIRTPLSAILGLLYLTKKHDISDIQRGYLNKVESSANLLLRIINDILDFSKIESEKLELEKNEFYIAEVIDNVTALVSSEVQAKGLEFIVNVSPKISDKLVGDHLRVVQILSNMVSNAIKFTEKGKITLKVKISSKAQNKMMLRFLIQDTGIGLTNKQIKNLFSAFTQADNTPTRRYSGTGLGLALSKCLVEMMGGTIWVESKYGRGSTFGFTAQFGINSTPGIPQPQIDTCDCKQKQTDKAEDPKLQEDQELLLLKEFIGTRILLAEDNELNQLVACSILEGAGLKVDVANNGREAVEMIKTGQYELVLMDIQMPEMDGLAATKEIRFLPEFKNLPILAMTANTMIGDAEISIKAGMNDHISKPIDIQKMFSALAKWLKKRDLQ